MCCKGIHIRTPSRSPHGVGRVAANVSGTASRVPGGGSARAGAPAHRGKMVADRLRRREPSTPPRLGAREETPVGQWNVSRRTVLGVAVSALAAGSTLTSSGCGRTDWYPYDVTPDVYVLRSLIAEKKRMVARYERALSDAVEPNGLLEGFLEHHLAHLDSLLSALPEGIGPQALEEETENAEEGSTSLEDEPTGPSVPVGPAGLRVLEAAAASARLDQAAAVRDPALAQLVSGIGACEAGHAHLFDEL